MKWMLVFSFLLTLNAGLCKEGPEAYRSDVYFQAITLKAEKQYAKSQELLKLILERKPSFAPAYVQLVAISSAQGELRDLEEYFKSLGEKNGRAALSDFGLGLIRA